MSTPAVVHESFFFLGILAGNDAVSFHLSSCFFLYDTFELRENNLQQQSSFSPDLPTPSTPHETENSIHRQFTTSTRVVGRNGKQRCRRYKRSGHVHKRAPICNSYESKEAGGLLKLLAAVAEDFCGLQEWKDFRVDDRLVKSIDEIYFSPTQVIESCCFSHRPSKPYCWAFSFHRPSETFQFVS